MRVFRRLVSTLAIALVVGACGSGGETATYVVTDTLEDPNPPAALAFEGFDEAIEVDEEGCSLLLETVTPVPFESTPVDVEAMALAYDRLGAADPRVAVGAAAAAQGFREAAVGGADATAMFEIWSNDSARTALRALAEIAWLSCDGPFPSFAMGPPDRLVELAQHRYPDASIEDPIGSWAMSITGEPKTIYWSFGYLGDDPVAVCTMLEDTLITVDYAGTFLNLHDGGTGDEQPDGTMGTILDLAETKVGDGCTVPD